MLYWDTQMNWKGDAIFSMQTKIKEKNYDAKYF